MLRSTLRRLRTVPALNRPLTTALRAATRGRPPTSIVDHLPRVGIVDVRLPSGATVRLRSGDDWITSRLWWLGMDGFDPGTLSVFLRLAADARVILDVGAYVGHYALFAAASNPDARVFAFEPVPEIRSRLLDNLALNAGLDVTVLPYAVADQPGQARFHLGGEHLPSSSSLSPSWEGIATSIDVTVVDLDGLAAEREIVDQIDLVKIDVETAEPAVIAGMTNILERSRPTIISEVLPGPGAEGGYQRMSDTLAGHGYRFFLIGHDGRTAPEPGLAPPTDYVDHLTTPVDHLAVHADRLPTWLA